MCPVGACDAYGYEGDVCHQTYMHKGEPHGPMIPIPRSAALDKQPGASRVEISQYLRGKVRESLSVPAGHLSYGRVHLDAQLVDRIAGLLLDIDLYGMGTPKTLDELRISYDLLFTGPT